MSELAEMFRQLIDVTPPTMTREIASEDAIRRACFVPEVRSADDSKRTIEFVASTETPDRMGDILRVSGWQTDAYMTNPVVLWAHDSRQPPIGRTLTITKEQSPPALVQLVQFADADTSPFADQIYRLYKQKFLRSVSVGFRPLKMPTPVLDENGIGTDGYEFSSMELLELSCVPIPANPEALARAVDCGIIAQADAAKFCSAKTKTLREALTEAHEVALAVGDTEKARVLDGLVHQLTAEHELRALLESGRERSGDITSMAQLEAALRE